MKSYPLVLLVEIHEDRIQAVEKNLGYVVIFSRYIIQLLLLSKSAIHSQSTRVKSMEHENAKTRKISYNMLALQNNIW